MTFTFAFGVTYVPSALIASLSDVDQVILVPYVAFVLESAKLLFTLVIELKYVSNSAFVFATLSPALQFHFAYKVAVVFSSETPGYVVIASPVNSGLSYQPTKVLPSLYGVGNNVGPKIVKLLV